MKKIITIVAALFIAAAAQAASIDWAITGAQAIKNPEGTAVGAGWTVYLVLTDSVADIEVAIANGTFAVGSDGVLGSATTTSAASNLGSTPVTITSGLLTDGTLYSFTSVYFDTATYVNGTTTQYKFSTASGYTPAYTGDTPTQTTWSSATFGGTWEDVTPEPTAMALLALGAAAVGLRRRFRK